MDGGAIRQTWLSRQNSGNRICQLCKNIFKLQSANENNMTMKMISRSSSKYILFNQLKIYTDQEILDSCKRLAERKKIETKSIMKRWQQACGYSCHPRGLLASACLPGLGLFKPSNGYPNGYLHDWMHGMVSHGALNHIMQWLLDTLIKPGIPITWQTCSNTFNFGLSPASQMLSLYPVCGILRPHLLLAA